jgi:Uma2 family endonuclease
MHMVARAAATTVVTVTDVEQFMLDHPKELWEVHRGELREKPEVSESHNIVLLRLIDQVLPQLDKQRFEARFNMGRVQYTSATYYIPDFYIVPIDGPRSIRNRPYKLEVFKEPLPFVAEGWSPSTGGYDVNEKIPEYQRRGDLEIWKLHPFDFTLTAWRRLYDGTYSVDIYRTGSLQLAALSDVTIDLDALFA